MKSLSESKKKLFELEQEILTTQVGSPDMPNISHILRDNMFSPEDKIRLLVLYAYQKGGISKGSQSVGIRLQLAKW